MAIFMHYKRDAFQVAVWKVEETLDTLLSLLPQERRTAYVHELEHFISERRKIEWLAVRVLLYTVLQEDKQIDYSLERKPFLTDHSFSISISHTKGYVAVMLGQQLNVGVDIENYGQRIHKVMSRFIRPDESILPYQEDDTWSLLLHWSTKEAIYKCMENPPIDLRSIRLSLFVPQEMGRLQAQELATERQQTFVVDYQIGVDFVLTWTLGVSYV